MKIAFLFFHFILFQGFGFISNEEFFDETFTIMATIVHLTYNCLQLLNQYLGTVWPIKVIIGKQSLQPISKDTELKVLRIFYLQKRKNDICQSKLDVKELVSSFPLNEDVLSVCDTTTGCNLLQFAIINGDKDLALSLLKWHCHHGYKHCSPPVHLAASWGELTILQHLLNNGMDSNFSAGICYPDPHQPVGHTKWLWLIDQPVYKCNKNQLLPIYWAIVNDRVSCFTLLLNHMINKGEITPEMVDLLHFACRRGAIKCIGKILSKNPSIVNSMDVNKDTPLLLAVVWGRVCSKTLIDFGADVKIVSSIGETALHRLYCNDVDGLFTIFDTTKYLLTTGVEQLINCKNNNGETPLHVLVSHVSYIGGSLTHPEEVSLKCSRPQLQPDYQNQVVETLELLLKFNADPGSQNYHGLQPLGKLMHIALKSCLQESEQCECVRLSISSKYSYKNDYGHLYSALKVLLHRGSDLNKSCLEGHTPLFLVMQCLLKDNIENLCEQSMGVISIVHLLLENGAKTMKFCHGGSTILAKIAARFLTISDNNLSIFADTRQKFSSLVNSLLETFLKNGLNPNYVTDIKSQHFQGGSGNSLIDFVRLTEMAAVPEDFIEIHRWLKTLFAWGADPDLEPYPSEPIICHSQSSIFLKKQDTQAMSHYIHVVKDMGINIFQDGNAQELLMLFYNTMSHDILYNCLNTARVISHFHPLGATRKSFLQILNSLAENPRSLKQNARVAIYKSIDRNLVEKVPQLPLPTLLKNYLLEIY